MHVDGMDVTETPVIQCESGLQHLVAAERLGCLTSPADFAVGRFPAVSHIPSGRGSAVAAD